MTDTVIKGTGNSRLIKSVPNLAALAPTYDKLLEMLSTEGLPVDISAPQAAGVDVFGTDYSKASVLPDSTEKLLWGTIANHAPAQAFDRLRNLITTAQNTANGRLRIEAGTYTGNGVFGQTITVGGFELPNAGFVTLNFSFPPKIVFVVHNDNKYNGVRHGALVAFRNSLYTWTSRGNVNSNNAIFDGNTMKIVCANGAHADGFNQESFTYTYYAIG